MTKFHPLRAGRIATAEDMGRPIQALELSVFVENLLRVQGVHTIGALVKLRPSYLLRMPNFGKKSLDQVERVLTQHGLELGTQPAKSTQQDSPVVQLSVKVARVLKTRLLARAKANKRTLTEQVVFQLTTEDRLKEDLAAGRMPVIAEPAAPVVPEGCSISTAFKGPFQAIAWECHAPTTVVCHEGDRQIVLAECSGNGRLSDENAVIAQWIAAALNAIRPGQPGAPVAEPAATPAPDVSAAPQEAWELLHDLRDACLEPDTDTCIPSSLGKRLMAITTMFPRARA